MSSNWIRVASGINLVASSLVTHVSKNGESMATFAARHGIDFSNNIKIAANAAFIQQQQQYDNRIVAPPLESEIKSLEKFTNNNNVNSTSSMKNDRLSSMNGFEKEKQEIKLNLDISKRIPVQSEMPEEIDSERMNMISNEESITINELKEKVLEIKPSIEKPLKESSDSLSNDNTTTIPKLISKDIPHEQPEQVESKLMLGQAVPSTRVKRAASFASLAVGLAAGTVSEFTSRLFQNKPTSTATTELPSSPSSMVLNDANADRIAATLCRMRGAALKLGQMLSIQDETLLPTPLTKALSQVRTGAYAMPTYQLHEQLSNQLGSDWNQRVNSFQEVPIAAASIGQVHRATIPSDDDKEKDIVMKVQYPGVANSIESDLSNLQMLVKVTGLAPPGLYIDEVIRVGRQELQLECDYVREMKHQMHFQSLVQSDPTLVKNKFVVPNVVKDLTTEQVLTMDYVPGGTIDKVAFLSQEERNRIARCIMRLTMLELFQWKFMQTDPNWGNFLYDVGTGTTYLIDFGATRDFSKTFVDGYLRIVWAAANRNTDELLHYSKQVGFLTGNENDIMLKAHELCGFTVGEPFSKDNDVYDFRNSNISARISNHSSAFLKHRLTPPPEEVYTLHRKLAGTYMLCIKLGAVISCRDLLEEVMDNYSFDSIEK